MEITIFIDHDMEGFDVFLVAGLQETGWDQLIRVEYKLLRDFGLPDNYPDQDIWRFVQQEEMLLVTSNRNSKGETSLQATMQRENSPEALPIVTVSDKELLRQADYRQRVAQSLARIIIDLDDYRGAGRLFIP